MEEYFLRKNYKSLAHTKVDLKIVKDFIPWPDQLALKEA